MTALDIDSIVVGRRMRPLGDVAALAESIAAIGLLNPITVVMRRQSPGSLERDEAPVLVAGYRRLEACRSLGFPEIEANVVELYDLDVQLAEIDENLKRENLTQLERSEQLFTRKTIWEQKFPETRHGARGGRGGREEKGANLAFYKNTSKSTGKGDRSVKREVSIAASIPAVLRDDLRDTDQADSQSDLEALARYKDQPAVQKAAVKAVKSGEAKNLRAALPKKPPTKSEQDKAIDELVAYLRTLNADPVRLTDILKPLKGKNPMCGKVLHRLKQPAPETVVKLVRS